MDPQQSSFNSKQLVALWLVETKKDSVCHVRFVFRAYEYFQAAAQLGNVEAKEKVAMALLFGDHLPQNILKYVHTSYELSLKSVIEGVSKARR